MTSESTKSSNLQSSKYYQSTPRREHCIFHRRRKDICIFKGRTVGKTIVLPFKICPSSFYEMGNHMWRHSSPCFVSVLMPMKISSYCLPVRIQMSWCIWTYTVLIWNIIFLQWCFICVYFWVDKVCCMAMFLGMLYYKLKIWSAHFIVESPQDALVSNYPTDTVLSK